MLRNFSGGLITFDLRPAHVKRETTVTSIAHVVEMAMHPGDPTFALYVFCQQVPTTFRLLRWSSVGTSAVQPPSPGRPVEIFRSIEGNFYTHVMHTLMQVFS